MTSYQITVTADKFPTSYNVKANSWNTAVARGVREWKKRFKGSRTKELKIHAVKG